jgi:hypothetical protein
MDLLIASYLAFQFFLLLLLRMRLILAAGRALFG